MGEEKAMLACPAKQPKPEPDHFECVVLDVKAHAPGFYTTAWRTFYVAQAGAVYLLRAPGQRATLHQLDDLPTDADPDTEAGHDPILGHLAAAIEALQRPAPAPEGRS